MSSRTCQVDATNVAQQQWPVRPLSQRSSRSALLGIRRRTYANARNGWPHLRDVRRCDGNNERAIASSSEM